MSCPAGEPNLIHCEYSQPFRHIRHAEPQVFGRCS